MASYAIVFTSGKQHCVQAGQRLKLDSLPQAVGEQIVLDRVLLLGGSAEPDTAIRVGQPFIEGASVTAKVISHQREAKIRVFKRRKRKGFHKTIGHRRNTTELEIITISG